MFSQGRFGLVVITEVFLEEEKMKKIFGSLLGFLCMVCMSAMYVQASAVSEEWDGSIEKPTKQVVVDTLTYYEISTPEELAYIAQTGGKWLSYNYILTNDIVLNAEELTCDEEGNLTVDAEGLREWTPIGGDWENYFTGIFDGNNHTISGLYIDTMDSYVGLFGHSRGRISNLGIVNSYVKGNEYVGGIAGYMHGAYTLYCYNEGNVIGDGYVGGIAGSFVAETVSVNSTRYRPAARRVTSRDFSTPCGSVW